MSSYIIAGSLVSDILPEPISVISSCTDLSAR